MRETSLRGDDDESMGSDVSEKLRVKRVIEKVTMEEDEQWEFSSFTGHPNQQRFRWWDWKLWLCRANISFHCLQHRPVLPNFKNICSCSRSRSRSSSSIRRRRHDSVMKVVLGYWNSFIMSFGISKFCVAFVASAQEAKRYFFVTGIEIFSKLTVAQKPCWLAVRVWPNIISGSCMYLGFWFYKLVFVWA